MNTHGVDKIIVYCRRPGDRNVLLPTHPTRRRPGHDIRRNGKGAEFFVSGHLQAHRIHVSEDALISTPRPPDLDRDLDLEDEARNLLLSPGRGRTYNRSRKRNTLSTRSNGISDVLHVRADDELARRGENACADAEFRVRAWLGTAVRVACILVRRFM